jgi:amino-acid N-acetyltransferase
LKIIKATVKDAKDIHAMVNRFAKRDDMLPRALNEIYENIRDYLICIDDGKIVAIAALHVLWDDLAEIRSIAVSTRHRNKGVGKKLIKRCVKDAAALGINRVFALTFHPAYFIKQGFEDIDKNDLPHKIWRDCLKCPKFPDCTESAVIKLINNK